MRKDHFSPPSKWTKEFRQALKMGHLHFAVYAYLEGAPESHRTGIYFITLSAIAEMVVADRDLAEQAMDDLERVGLIHWDRDHDVVWVPCVCAEQYRWKTSEKSKKDNGTMEGRKHIASLPRSRLVGLFLADWPVFNQGAWQGASEGAYEGAYEGTPYTTTCAPAPPSQPTDAGRRQKSGGGR